MQASQLPCRSRLAILAALALAALARPAAAGEEGLRAYNQSPLSHLSPGEFKAAGAELKPLTIVGARNGVFAEALVISSPAAISKLSVKASELKGPGVIPAGAVQVLYGVADGAPAKRDLSGLFDSLEETPPAEVPVDKKSGLAVQLLWIRVRVPADAKPGDYQGTIAASAGGQSVEAALKLKVFDWTVSDPRDWSARMDIIESPESVALAYDVELWSEKHLALLDKTFAILGEMGQKTLYLTAIRRTHFGNEHALVRWCRDEKGELQPDFANVEKYLEVASKHLGKIPGVILYCWEPIKAEGHAGGAGEASRSTDKPVQYSFWDREKNALKERTGPDWGTPESKAFWKKVTDGIAPVLDKRGLKDSLLLGLVGDDRPTKQAMDDIGNALANPRWAIHSHFYCLEWRGYKMGMSIALWGIHLNITDPAKGRGFSWKSDFWLSYYPREFTMSSPLPEYRYKMEMWMGACSLFELGQTGKSRYAKGLGRIGGDFWKVLKDARGNLRGTLADRYPEAHWGQLNLNYCIPSILGKGKDGALRTVRSEAFREGSQDAEARVFLEKATEIHKYRQKLGEELAGKVRALLDERIRMINRWGGPREDQKSGSLGEAALDPKSHNQKLYAAAEEVAGKLGTGRIEESEDPDAPPPPPKKK